MPIFHAEPAAPGQKTARMEQRTTEQAKNLIERAAALLGVNASEFTVAARPKRRAKHCAITRRPRSARKTTPPSCARSTRPSRQTISSH